MSAKDYFWFAPERSCFGDIAHDVRCLETMFEGLLAALPEAHAQHRLEAWKKAAHSIIDLFGGDSPPRRAPSLPVLWEREATRNLRERQEKRRHEPSLSTIVGWQKQDRMVARMIAEIRWRSDASRRIDAADDPAPGTAEAV